MTEETRVPTRIADGSIARLTRSELRADAEDGAAQAVRRAEVPPLEQDEQDHILDIFASPALTGHLPASSSMAGEYYRRCVHTRCYPSSMVSKPHPNQAICLEPLRRMTPEQRLLEAPERTEMSRELPHAGILQQSPARARRSGSACTRSSSSSVGTGLPEAPVAAR